jgi:hypothetical protein
MTSFGPKVGMRFTAILMIVALVATAAANVDAGLRAIDRGDFAGAIATY